MAIFSAGSWQLGIRRELLTGPTVRVVSFPGTPRRVLPFLVLRCASCGLSSASWTHPSALLRAYDPKKDRLLGGRQKAHVELESARAFCRRPFTGGGSGRGWRGGARRDSGVFFSIRTSSTALRHRLLSTTCRSGSCCRPWTRSALSCEVRCIIESFS